MAHHAPAVDPAALRVEIGDLAGKLRIPLLITGVVGLVAAGLFASVSEDGLAKRFLFGYLWAYWFFLTICLGGLFFTMIQHVARAGWSVTIRRLAEMLAANLWVFAPLGLPMVVAVLMGGMDVWQWADEDYVENSAISDLLKHKAPYLNKWFFLIRCIIYFTVWSFWGRKMYALSRKQDETGDVSLTQTMHNWSVAGLPLFALTVTFAAIDFLMTLTPTWYSTIYGVLVFAGCAVSVHATLAVFVLLLRKRGLLTEAVTVEHQQDLGKFLFGFIVFWAY
ncbi:MAG: quinol:cytochrome C oxidoreductase, partial [Planctomycetota bacterium]